MKTPKINFKLKETSEGNRTPINLFIFFLKCKFKYATGEFIDPTFWDKNTQRANIDKKTMDKDTIRENERINFKLNEYQSALKRYFDYFDYQRITPTPEILKEQFDNDFRPDIPKKKPKVTDLNTYINDFISELENGKRLTDKKQRYSPNTIKTYKGFQVQFKNFQDEIHRKINFDHVNIDLYNQFIEYFTEKDYKLNTIGRHIKHLKVIIRASRDEGLHQNNEIDRKAFKAVKTEVDNIYLTKKEINDISELDFSENKVLDVYRDIFLIGVYTAQRYSDFSRINKNQIKTLQSGVKVITLKQTKTGNQVIIPISPELDKILTKYDYTLPRTHEQKMNEHLKDIGDKAKITDLIEIEVIKGGMKITKSVPKNKLIKTHTARRTGATLMYLSKIDTISAMKITGHKTEREFMNYIKISNQENAEILSKHSFFLGTPLKLVK